MEPAQSLALMGSLRINVVVSDLPEFLVKLVDINLQPLHGLLSNTYRGGSLAAHCRRVPE